MMGILNTRCTKAEYCDYARAYCTFIIVCNVNYYSRHGH